MINNSKPIIDQRPSASKDLSKSFPDVAVQLTGDVDFDELLKKCISILKVKGADYTIGTGDKLHNFKTTSEFMGLTPKQVLGTFLYKHMSAVFAYIKNDGQTESEPISGRLADVINYMLLLHKMIKEDEGKLDKEFDKPCYDKK